MQPKVNVYDDYAAVYGEMVNAREERGIDSEPLIPPLLEIIGDVNGLEVLDAGCGEGYLSRILAGRGARVTGIDVAAGLIEIARSKDPAGRITYRAHNLSTPLPELEGRFDLIASHFVLNDVPDYQGFATTLASLLKPGGRLALSMNNPYSFVIRNHIQDYFAPGTAYSYRGMAKEGLGVFFYQRTLQQYLDAFLGAGLQLQRLIDVATPEWMLAKLTDKLTPDGYQFPFFMILSFSKPQ